MERSPDTPLGRMLRRVGDLFGGRTVLLLTALVIVSATIWAFRFPLMRATGNFLIREDPAMPADAAYVLGGAPVERGAEAARLLEKGLVPVAICMGSNINRVLRAEGIELTEAGLTRNAALRAGADSGRVELLVAGTSTWEESEAILAHALARGFDTIIVVTTEFHLRRVGRVFRERFEERGITVLLRGAPGMQYDSRRWWASEEGLLMVNNEYVKLVYYWLKY